MKILRYCLALLSVFTLALAAPSAVAAHHLQVGDKAPRVGGINQEGEKWSVSTDFGKKYLLLYFYPRDNTPGCTKEACGLRDRMGELKSEGVDVVGVSFDSAESHKKFAFDYDLNFPLIADTDGHIADAYGARQAPHEKIDRRISFLIGLDGRIIHITDSPDPQVHLEEMRLAIKRLNAKS
jgi:peroxiredoxin Q/BCP